MSARPAGDRPLPPVANEMLQSLYQHRLLSTPQLHALHTPDADVAWTRRVLRLLADRALVQRVQAPGTLSHWFLTDTGADTVETVGERTETRRRVPTRAQAEGPLRAHTLAVNEVGVAFVKAARERGDECGPQSWRHEIAHPITPPAGRRPPELLIADALLTYLQVEADGGIVLHQRWIELDRGTARPADQLAQKITRYTRLRYHTRPGQQEPAWRSHYRSFPHLLIVLAEQSPRRARQRIQRTLALARSDPAKPQHARIPVSFVTLGDLTQHGPFAAIFTTPDQPDQRADWLGQATPRERAPA